MGRNIDLEKKLLKEIQKYRLLLPGDKVLAAVSGGADSTALLLLLKQLEDELQIQVEALTVNHGIRGESEERDVQMVSELCRQYEIPLHICRVNVPEFAWRNHLSEEEAARMARYDCIEGVARQIGAKAAVAHHQGDQCETVLHNLFRGSSLKGLGGMERMRNLNGICLIRPLLHFDRKELENWLTSRRVIWCSDETNQELLYTRNRLRNQIIPEIKSKVNEQAVRHTAQAAEDILEAAQLIGELAADWIQKEAVFEKGTVMLSVSSLKKQKAIVQREILMQIISSVRGSTGRKDISRIHLEMIQELSDRHGEHFLNLGRMQVKKVYDGLYFYIEEKPSEKGTVDNYPAQEAVDIPVKSSCAEISDFSISAEGIDKNVLSSMNVRIFSYNGQKIPENSYTKWLDYDKIKNGMYRSYPSLCYYQDLSNLSE